MQLKEAREQARLSQSELANKIGVNQCTISFIENGETYPSAVQQVKINNVLNADVDWSKHPNAPLNANETKLFPELYKYVTNALESADEAEEFLAKQSPASIRKLMKLTGVNREVKALSVNGYPRIGRNK